MGDLVFHIPPEYHHLSCSFLRELLFQIPPPHVSSSFMQPLGGSSSCTPHLTHIPEREEKDDPIMEDDEVYKEHVNHIAYENLVIDG